MSTELRAAAAELLLFLRRMFDDHATYFAERYVAGEATSDGEVTLVYAAGGDTRLYGWTWTVQELREGFGDYDPQDMAEILWFEDVSCPNGDGRTDPDRARHLVAEPERVRWVGR